MSFLPKIIKYILILAIFTPLIVGGSFIFPYIAPKIFAFELITELAFILWIYLILRKPEYRPSKNIVTISLSIFFLILIITSFLGVNVYRSFFMDYERMDGIFHLLHFFIFFLIASSVFRKKDDWLELFSLSAIITPIVALTFQVNGYGHRLSGSLGNPDFIACYATFNLIFSIFILYSVYQKFIQNKESIRSKIYLIAGTIGLISTPLMIWFSATRGAILAFIAVLGLNILILPWIKINKQFILPTKLRKGLIVLIFIGILSIGGLFLAKNNSEFDNLVNQNYTLKRLTHISVSSGTVRNRLLVWQYGWAGFEERPIRGWGWENFLVPFNKHYTNKLSEPWFDKSHNEYLDILISSGIFGLSAYLFIFISAFYLLRKYYLLNPKKNFWTAWMFTSLLIFYLLQNIPLFDTPAILLMIFTTLSFIAWLSPQNQVETSQNDSRSLDFNYLGWAIYSLIVIIIIVISYQWVIKPAYASKQAIDGFSYYLIASRVKNQTQSDLYLEKSQQKISRALSLNTYGSPEIIKIFSNYLNNLNQIKASTKEKQKYLSWANKSIIKTIQKYSSDDIRYIIALISFQINHFRNNPRVMAQAEKIIHSAIKMSPKRPEVWQNLAWTQIFQKKNKEAIQSLKKAVKLSYHPAKAKYFLGLGYYFTNQNDLAKKVLQESAKLNYGPAKKLLKKIEIKKVKKIKNNT